MLGVSMFRLSEIDPYFPTNTNSQVNLISLMQVLAHVLILELDYIVLVRFNI